VVLDRSPLPSFFDRHGTLHARSLLLIPAALNSRNESFLLRRSDFKRRREQVGMGLGKPSVNRSCVNGTSFDALSRTFLKEPLCAFLGHARFASIFRLWRAFVSRKFQHCFPREVSRWYGNVVPPDVLLPALPNVFFFQWDSAMDFVSFSFLRDQFGVLGLYPPPLCSPLPFFSALRQSAHVGLGFGVARTSFPPFHLGWQAGIFLTSVN